MLLIGAGPGENTPFGPAGYNEFGDENTIALDNVKVDFGSTVVPLPAALPLFASALVGFGLVGYRRRKA